MPLTRATKLVPALTLLLAGFAITFTQTLHGSLSFNSWVFAVFAVLLGAVMFLVRRPGSLVLGSVSVIAGIVAPFTRTTGQFALLMIVWAVLVAVIEFWPSVRGGHRESVVLGALAGMLAIVLAVTNGELLMVVGFFASYAILAGVYLAIGAFDRPGLDAAAAGGSAPLTGENGL